MTSFFDTCFVHYIFRILLYTHISNDWSFNTVVAFKYHCIKQGKKDITPGHSDSQIQPLVLWTEHYSKYRFSLSGHVEMGPLVCYNTNLDLSVYKYFNHSNTAYIRCSASLYFFFNWGYLLTLRSFPLTYTRVCLWCIGIWQLQCCNLETDSTS